jgi:hypothetical protein
MFETARDFSIHIETTAIEHNLSVVDVLLQYCEDNFIEPDEVAKMVSKPLKDKLELNFIEMNYLPKTASLEI